MYGLIFIRRIVVLVEWIHHRDRFNYTYTSFLSLALSLCLTLLFSSCLATKYLVWWLILFFFSLYLIQGATCRLMLLGFLFLLFLFVTYLLAFHRVYHIIINPHQTKWNIRKQTMFCSRNSIYLKKNENSLVCVCVFSLAWFSPLLLFLMTGEDKKNKFSFFRFYYIYIYTCTRRMLFISVLISIKYTNGLFEISCVRPKIDNLIKYGWDIADFWNRKIY
jgi:hypothetical protein